jgi:hydrogenase maturation protease
MMVAQELAGRLPTDVALLARNGDMLALIEDWATFDAVVCVDAAAPMGAPGRIHRIDLKIEELPRSMSFTSSHAFGLADAVRLARTLQLAPQDIVIYAVEGCCFDGGAPVTAEVVTAAGELAHRIVAEAGSLLQNLHRGRASCRR